MNFKPKMKQVTATMAQFISLRNRTALSAKTSAQKTSDRKLFGPVA
jgi:hypothetical protein